MVSRKRSKGQARRAKAIEKEKAHRMREYLKVMKGPREMARLVPSLQGHVMWSNCSCRHGLALLTDLRLEEEIVKKFTNEFNTFLENYTGTPLNWANIVQMAYRRAAQVTFNAYDIMWEDDRIVSFLLTCGTQHLLDGNMSSARDCAFIACSYQQFYRVFIHKTHPNENIPKLIETYTADDHTLVSFFNKRIGCSCLSEKYKKVKSLPKMGICFNEFCCKTSLERQKTKCCSRCRLETYCSRDCQSDHWKVHKVICDLRMEWFERFNLSSAHMQEKEGDH
jgi:hypothetical protein